MAVTAAAGQVAAAAVAGPAAAAVADGTRDRSRRKNSLTMRMSNDFRRSTWYK